MMPVFIPGGKSAEALRKQGPIRYFIAEAYKHGKPVATVDEGEDLVKMAITLEGITEPESAKKAPDNRTLGLIFGKGGDIKEWLKVL